MYWIFIHIIPVQSQNAAFGLPSSFSWIEKYTGVPSPAINPFAEDTFDPFQATTTQQTPSPATTANNSECGLFSNLHPSRQLLLSFEGKLAKWK